jgi:DUF4097 and DUF4098 domain-containing protein YvlB
MAKEQIKVGESPFIRVESCGGDLIIRGWAESGLQIKGDYGMKETEKGYSLTSRGNLTLSVPEGALLSVGQTGGDLIVKHVSGSCEFERVHGDMVLSDVGDVELGTVHGDLAARNMRGALTVTEVNGDISVRGAETLTLHTVHGDLSARRVDGHLTVESISGDADLRYVDGDVTINQGHRDVNLAGIIGQVAVVGVNGDVRLRGGLESGNHTLEAQGDIVIRWPTGRPLNLVASGAGITNQLPLEDVVEKNGSLIGRIGQGEVNLTVAATGRVILKEAEIIDEKWDNFGGEMEFEFGVEMAGIGARIEAELNNHLSRVTRDFETKFGADFGQRFADKMARKAEKAADRARRRAEPRGRTVGFDFSSTPSAPARKSTSPEEQLKILKMVETGKITPEEAGMLLEALEN